MADFKLPDRRDGRNLLGDGKRHSELPTSSACRILRRTLRDDCQDPRLDRFSEGEKAILDNHGYLLAEAAVQQHLPSLVPQLVPLLMPHPEWMKELNAKKVLKDSWKRKILGH
jgi:hypothetical protein